MIGDAREFKSSAMYIGYLILRKMKNDNVERISIYDISKALKSSGINSSRQLIIGLSFLYATGIVDFEEAMVWVKK